MQASRSDRPQHLRRVQSGLHLQQMSGRESARSGESKLRYRIAPKPFVPDKTTLKLAQMPWVLFQRHLKIGSLLGLRNMLFFSGDTQSCSRILLIPVTPKACWEQSSPTPVNFEEVPGVAHLGKSCVPGHFWEPVLAGDEHTSCECTVAHLLPPTTTKHVHFHSPSVRVKVQHGSGTVPFL